MVAYGSARLHAYEKFPFLRCGIVFSDRTVMRPQIRFGPRKTKYRQFDHGNADGLAQFRQILQSVPLPHIDDDHASHLR